MPSLAIFRTHPWATGVGIFLYSIAVTLPHQWVQDWLAIHVAGPLGIGRFYFVMATLAVAALAAASILLLRQLPGHPARRELVIYGTLTLMLVLLAWRFLSVNNSELVHFPQYAVSGFVLMALTLSATETLSWVVLLGGIDEAHQYAVMHPGWGIPYDFNDVTLDLLGGTIGMLLCLLWLGAAPRLRRARPGPGTVLLALVFVTGLFLLLADRALLYEDKRRSDYWFALSRLLPQGFWFHDPTWGPRTIHALTPIEGPLLLIALLALYSLLDRRYEFRPRG